MDVTSTLATCLKDILHFAQELKRSVEKIPQNRRKARKLSDELVSGLVDIEKFYGARGSTLDGNTELEKALAELLKQVKAVQTRCVQLLGSQERGWRKIGSAFKAWKECDKIEQEIADLKDSVHGCYRKLTTMAISRIKTVASEGSIVRLNESQSLMLGNMEGFLTTLQSSSGVASSSTPVFIQPSQDIINALYLHHQVKTISNSLSRLSTSRTFAKEQPNDNYLLPFKTFVSRPISASSREDDHRDVVAKTLEIIKLLKGDSAELSVQDGAWDMINLAIKLYGFEMYSDAESMGTWTVTMYRALVATNRAVYAPYLALALRNLTRYKSSMHDKEGALAAISESVEIQRQLLEQNPSALDIRLHLVNALCEYWFTAKDGEKRLEIAKEALSIAESIHADLATGNHFPDSSPPPYIEAPYVQVEEISTKPDTSGKLDEEDALWLQHNTARALYCLSYSLHDADRVDEAYDTQLRALGIYETLVKSHGDLFIENLASSCAHLVSTDLRKGRPVEQSLKYAERAIEIYRERTLVQPVKCMPWLLESLWDYAGILHASERIEDVQRVTDEAVMLVRRSNQNRKILAETLASSCLQLRQLKNNETAVILRKEAIDIYRTLGVKEPTPEPSSSTATDTINSCVVPDALMDLANDLLLADKTDEAVIACQEAVDIYRTRLLKQNNDIEASVDLARSLSYLSHCNLRAKHYSAAAKIGNEAIILYHTAYHAQGTKFESVDNYVSALRRTTMATLYCTDADAITINAAVLEGLRIVAKDHKDKVGQTLIHTHNDRDFILGIHGRVREAIQINEQLLGLLASPANDAATAAHYALATVNYARNLYDLARPKDALLACGKAVEVLSQFSTDAITKELACAFADLRAIQAALLTGFGRYAEAEAIMKLSVDASRIHLTSAEDTLLACRCRSYSNILRWLGRLDDALKYGEEAVAICRSSTNKGLFVAARLPFCLDAYATTMAFSGDNNQRALELIQESVGVYRTFKTIPTDPLVPWVYAELLYLEALLLLASCLMVEEDYGQAFEVLTETKEAYQGIIPVRPGELSHFLVCLDLLALNRRALGLYEEEQNIMEDLQERQRAMELVTPDLAIVARVMLNDMRSRPSQMRLRARFDTSTTDLKEHVGRTDLRGVA
ncbi:hypothetical protein H0H92_010879 [Tricholoma furcatifolium]|nr:hypothetical protein H0H92_010879 [Tricholoma furcatifolium]